MLYVIAPTVIQAMSLAAEVGEPRKTTVPITPRNYWTATRGYELKDTDTILFAAGTPYNENIDQTLNLLAVSLTPDAQWRCRVLEWELRS